MFQGLLVIDPAMSFMAVLFLFIVSIFLLVYKEKISAFVILPFGIFIFVLLALSCYQFIVDDVYISLRYARNLADGYGLVFSTDGTRPVEGYTNFLWVVIEAPLFLLKLPDDMILHAIRIIGMVFGAGIVLLIYFLMRILDFNNRISLASALFLCILPEFAFWAIGGLETPMYIFWLLAGIYSYIWERKYNRHHLISVIFLFLLSLTRPEGLYVAGAVILYHLIQASRLKKQYPAAAKNAFHKMLPGILIFTVLYGAYFIWRYTTYGYLFPNTYYAKRVADVGQLYGRTQQIGAFIGPLLPFFAIAVFGFFQFNKKMAYEKSLLGILLLILLAFCWLARFEWMPGHRYELPFAPLVMIFFAAGLHKILFSDLNKWKVKPTTRFVPLIVLFFFGAFMLSRFNDLRKKGDDFARQLNRAHVQLGHWLKTYAPTGSSYASWDMGAVPYFSGMNTIIDINLEGLLNPYTAHHGYDIDRLLSHHPDFLVLPPNTAYVKPRDILDFYRNPQFKENYDYLFQVYFDRDYILYVYKHKTVNLPGAALQNANNITASSRGEALY